MGPTVDDILRSCGFDTFGDDPPAEAIEAALRRLGMRAAGADAVTREALRAGAIRAIRVHGWRVSAVDEVLKGAPNDNVPTGAGSRISLENPEPWQEAVEGGELVGELVPTFARFLGLPRYVYIVFALWVLHTHAHDAADISPLLALISPEKRCAKTTALNVLWALVPRPLPASNVTSAALFRAVEHFRPTLLVDEADTFLRGRDELRGVLNSGHARASAVVVRTVGDDHEVRTFSTWAPKAIAMIGTLPDTLADRSIVVPMRRRRPDEHVERLRLDRLGALEPLRRRAWTWARDHLDVLRAADPEMPSELHDRAADNWRPLLAIADTIGGEWSERARDAARELAGADDGDDGSVRTLLLRDVRDVFVDRGVDRITSSELAAELAKMEHRPWPEWGRQKKPMTTAAMARQLKPFGVRPKQMKDAGEKVRGYELSDLTEAFARYLPPRGGAEAVPPVPSNDGAGFRGFPNRYPDEGGTALESAEKPCGKPKVPGVPVWDGGPGQEDIPELNLWSGGPDAHDDDDDYERVERAAIRVESEGLWDDPEPIDDEEPFSWI